MAKPKSKNDFDYFEAEPLALTADTDQMPVIGIGLEEHLTFPKLSKRLPASGDHATTRKKFPAVQLAEMGAIRINAMNQSCTAIQVLSWGSAGADKLTGSKAIQFAKDCNDSIFDAIKASPAPERFRAFAHLPTDNAQAAARELERCVTHLGFLGALIVGMQQGRFLDSPEFKALLDKAEKLDVPIYLHPGLPPDAVKQTYHYTTRYLSQQAAYMLSTAALNWHQEVATHVLRLCYSGTFDRHPNLKIIIGHNGEMLSTWFERCDQMNGKLGIKRPISDMLRKHVWVALSGIFSLTALQAATQSFGPDHVCWAVDYPYVQEAVDQARFFCKSMRDVMSNKQVHMIMHENAQKLLKI